MESVGGSAEALGTMAEVNRRSSPQSHPRLHECYHNPQFVDANAGSSPSTVTTAAPKDNSNPTEVVL